MYVFIKLRSDHFFRIFVYLNTQVFQTNIFSKNSVIFININNYTRDALTDHGNKSVSLARILKLIRLIF